MSPLENAASVLRLFTPDTDPDMIAPIRPSTRGLFFQYRELGRLCLDALRLAGKPMTLDQIASHVMLAKGLPASPGGAVGQIAFTAEDAVKMAGHGSAKNSIARSRVVLIRSSGTP